MDASWLCIQNFSSKIKHTLINDKVFANRRNTKNINFTHILLYQVHQDNIFFKIWEWGTLIGSTCIWVKELTTSVYREKAFYLVKLLCLFCSSTKKSNTASNTFMSQVYLLFTSFITCSFFRLLITCFLKAVLVKYHFPCIYYINFSVFV